MFRVLFVGKECLCLVRVMLLVPFVFGETSASCLSHAPCPVRLGEKKKLTVEFREDIPRKDVCYVDERALFRVRVYRVDFTEPTCARLMWFGICVVGIS